MAPLQGAIAFAEMAGGRAASPSTGFPMWRGFCRYFFSRIDRGIANALIWLHWRRWKVAILKIALVGLRTSSASRRPPRLAFNQSGKADIARVAIANRRRGTYGAVKPGTTECRSVLRFLGLDLSPSDEVLAFGPMKCLL